MDKQQVIGFAKALGLSKIDGKSRKGWVIFRCPMARWTHSKGVDNEPSAGIRIGKSFFTCFSCQEHGDLETLLIKLAAKTKGNLIASSRIKAAWEFLSQNSKPVLSIGKQEDEEEDVDEIVEFPEWFIAGMLPGHDHPYLATRKGGAIPVEVGKLMGFRYDWKKERLGVPIRDFDGHLMGFHGRTLTDHPIPYMAYTFDGHWNRPVWSGEHRIDISKPLIVVESIFDEARVMQVWQNVCSPLSASINDAKIKRIGSALKIIEMFDDDKAGQIAAKKLKEGLPDSVIVSPGQVDGFNDPGETPALLLYEHLKHILPLGDPIL